MNGRAAYGIVRTIDRNIICLAARPCQWLRRRLQKPETPELEYLTLKGVY